MHHLPYVFSRGINYRIGPNIRRGFCSKNSTLKRGVVLFSRTRLNSVNIYIHIFNLCIYFFNCRYRPLSFTTMPNATTLNNGEAKRLFCPYQICRFHLRFVMSVARLSTVNQRDAGRQCEGENTTVNRDSALICVPFYSLSGCSLCSPDSTTCTETKEMNGDLRNNL